MMRLERLNYNKIKIFLTFDDLTERGLSKEDMWNNSLKVQQLFRDMVDQASEELGFQPTQSLAVEVFALQAQGMVVILTTSSEDLSDQEDDDFMDDYIQMQVTLDENQDIFFEFSSFEDVIQLANRLSPLDVKSGTLYSYGKHFYLLVDTENEENLDTETLVALLAEYGYPSTLTKYRVHEYGKMLLEKNALSFIAEKFSS